MTKEQQQSTCSTCERAERGWETGPAAWCYTSCAQVEEYRDAQEDSWPMALIGAAK